MFVATVIFDDVRMVDVSACVTVDDAAAAAAAAAATDDIVDTVMGKEKKKEKYSLAKERKTKKKL